MDMPTEPLDVLVVAPHPDDAELGMAGGILKLKASGQRVGVIDLTDGEPTPHGTVELRAQETNRATALLDVDWRGNLGLPNRSLEANLDTRRKLAEVFRRTKPRWLSIAIPAIGETFQSTISSSPTSARKRGHLTAL